MTRICLYLSKNQEQQVAFMARVKNTNRNDILREALRLGAAQIQMKRATKFKGFKLASEL